MEALAQATLDEFDRLHGRLYAVLEGLDEDALDRAPAEGENSIAVLVTHVLGAELGWLHRAAGRPFTRDRDSEFRVKASAAALRTAIETTERQVRELIEVSAAEGLGTLRKLGSGQEVTAAYCLSYTLSHTAEHVGHAELTRHLIGYR